MWPPGVTIGTTGSQSQNVAQAEAPVGDNSKSPAASAATTTTLFNLLPS